MGGYMGYFILTGLFSLIGMFVSKRLKSKFAKYSKMPMRNGKTGAEAAATMLRHYNIRDVKIIEGQGYLTDHYNPTNKTVTLSPEVFHGRHVAATAVATHEVGHAVQHNEAYAMLKMRSTLVPIVNVASRAQQYLLMFALGAMGLSGNSTMLLITIAAFGITALFSLITLPVEFDASKRALAWLESSHYAGREEHEGAKDALWWAAMTYVVAALSALVIVMYLLLRFAASRN